ncbi:class I SAM-dependent methyltransferase [Halococcus saccharolyticus]|uniref:Methyltransferase family protein n=1 Tax=Halococcus saccharolyticus DSM 5350 TaxID=1227455 RepID=M0MR29_9EURY|nr:class I SAM-dependent methyltransferase [Halococcus saccharolyticus]EMA47199.1 methyltransferase family protein [Halococcus saccharolyticus DSM 5350]
MSNTDDRFRRYLAAKRTVDDRALDRQVFDRLATEVTRLDEERGERPFRVLDVGAGIGATLERLVEHDVLPAAVEYTLVDRQAANVDAVRERLPWWATDVGYEATEVDSGLRIENEDRWIDIEFAVADAFEYVETSTWDLLIGQAFLDLFDTERAFDALRDGLRPGGCWYFPITFDGGTVLRPTVDPDLDARIERAFHAHIDDGGDSHAGSHLLARASEIDTVLAAGGSDWVVHPRSGEYPDDETFFLRYIVDTIAGALDETGQCDSATLAGWAAARHRQIDRGELVYVAHQLDALGRIPAER